jgi:hypothetical protein
MKIRGDMMNDLYDRLALSVQIWEDCGTCDGSGNVPKTHKSWDSQGHQTERSCPYEWCEKPCPDCGGSGKQLKDGVVPVFRQGGLSGAFYPADDDPDGYVIPAKMVEANDAAS